MIAANTVSRASVVPCAPSASISETIKDTSITVTETASTSVPNGSPTRWATTSAWWTAASTLPMRIKAATATPKLPIAPSDASTATMPSGGSATDQRGCKGEWVMIENLE